MTGRLRLARSKACGCAMKTRARLHPRRLAIAAIARVRFFLPVGRWGDMLAAVGDSLVKRGRIPRLRTPRLFNDHLLRLRADGSLRAPLRRYVTDKEHMKAYVAARVGAEYTLSTYAVLHNHDEIDQFEVEQLPCVIKPTHMSGRVLIYTDPHKEVDREKLKRWLSTDYYRWTREANYCNLRRKIIIEEFFSADGRTVPRDYKVFCFHGRPHIIQVDSDRFRDHARNFYDLEWNRLPIEIARPGKHEDDPRPRRLDEMIDVSRSLSEAFTSIRVDLYADDHSVKVGELTNCHGGGTETVRPASAESWLGDLFDQRVDISVDGRVRDV